jgi:hypothetical protein
MARIFTTPAAEQAAKRWLAIVTVAGGLRNDSSIGSVGDARFKTFATDICDELVNRNFNIIDNSIRQISYYGFSMPGSGKTKHLKPEQIAKCIVYMAEQVQLYWDDTIRTPYEIEEFKKSYLGNAVYAYGRYISAIPDKSTRSRASSTSAGSSSATGGAANNGQPKNGYKQSGPQSGNVRDLRDLDGVNAGTPGNKVYAQGPYIYKIIGDKTGSNTPNVFIKPLSASGAVGNTNKIFISSGNGYTDCTCYFDDPNEAQGFLDKINQNNRVPNNVANLRVVKLKADTNGYFLVGTEFGAVAISAKTLNEALEEAMNEQTKRTANWEKATEGYTREQLDELHTWMRRD